VQFGATPKRLEEILNRNRIKGTNMFCSRQFVRAVDELSAALEAASQLDSIAGDGGGHEQVMAVLLSSRAACLLELGDYRAAIEDGDRALERKPNHVQAWVTKCACLDTLGLAEEYARPVRAAVRVFGHSNPVVSSLSTQAMATRPEDSLEAPLIATDEVFSN